MMKVSHDRREFFALRERFPEARQAPCSQGVPPYLQTQFRPFESDTALLIVDADSGQRTEWFMDRILSDPKWHDFDLVLVERDAASGARNSHDARKRGAKIRLQLSPTAGPAGALRAALDWAARHGHERAVFCGINGRGSLVDIQSAIYNLGSGIDALFWMPDRGPQWARCDMMLGMMGLSRKAMRQDRLLACERAWTLQGKELLRFVQMSMANQEGIRSVCVESGVFDLSGESARVSSMSGLSKWIATRRIQKILPHISLGSEKEP